MKSTLCALGLVVALPSLPLAHVGSRPRESRPGTEERYSVRVPTEGAVATMSVRLEIPNGVSVLEVEELGRRILRGRQEGCRMITKWTDTSTAAAQGGSGDSGAVEPWLKGYDAAVKVKMGETSSRPVRRPPAQ